MVFLRCWATLHSAAGLQSLGFNTAHVRVLLHSSIDNEEIPLGQRLLHLGSSVINDHIPFLLDECIVQLGCLDLLIELIAEGSAGQVDVGFVRFPVQGLIRPGWVMPASSPIQNTAQGYPMGILNVSVYTEVPDNGPANYPHPPAGPHAPYLNPGHYRPSAPQQYQPLNVFGNLGSHFLGGLFGQIASGGMNQDMFGNGFSIEDLIASGFSIEDLIASCFM